MSEPAREVPPSHPGEVRVGSPTNALARSRALERSLAAGPGQWLSLLAVALAALVADQLTKHVVVRTLALDDA